MLAVNTMPKYKPVKIYSEGFSFIEESDLQRVLDEQSNQGYTLHSLHYVSTQCVMFIFQKYE